MKPASCSAKGVGRRLRWARNEIKQFERAPCSNEVMIDRYRRAQALLLAYRLTKDIQ